MTTLKDVAERAGVSVSIVSYVLNGKKKVRPETLKRIEDAIEELDYCPNLLASSLKTNLSKTVGVVVSDFENLFFIELLKSMEEELAKEGYCMTVCNADNSSEKEKKCLRRLLSRNIDGLILIGTGTSDLSNYKNIKLPFVCMDRDSGKDFFTVRVDHVMGGKIGTEYLLKNGRQKILFVGNMNYQFAKDRYEGYVRAMTEAGLDKEIQLVQLSSLESEEAYNAVCQLLEKEVKFDAVFGCFDYIAIGAMKALQRHRIKIPEEVAVLGYDDIAPARFTYPELTTVAQPKEKMGHTAVHYLLEMISGEKKKGEEVLLKPYIVERESC